MLRSLCLRVPTPLLASRGIVSKAQWDRPYKVVSNFSRHLATGEKGAASDTTQTTDEDDIFEDNNMLEGKRSRDSIHQALSNRAMDVIRYDYFAQRAELEAEFEAASAFRSLSEMSKQQAMGYLEFMEEYGDAEFGSTVDNLDICAAAEHENAEEYYRNASSVAAEENLEDLEDWFTDMSSASSRAAARLELVSSMIDAEMMGEDEEDGDDIPENVKN